MKTKFTILLGFIACCHFASAQTFQKLYGTSGFSGTSGYGRSIQSTSDGGYIVGADNGDVYLLKTDAGGALQWSKTFSYGQYGGDYVLSVAQTSDGGYITLGFSTTPSYNYAMTLVKTDANGTLQWSEAIDSIATMPVGLVYKGALAVTSDGGYIISYYRTLGGQATAVVKLSSSGAIQWSNSYSTGWSHITGITPVADGYIIYGEEYGSSSSWDALLFKIDFTGVLKWSKSCPMDASIRKLETLYSVKTTLDGGYVGSAVAYISGTGGGLFPAIIKMDSTLTTQWCTVFKPDASEFPSGGGWGYDVEQINNNNYTLLAWFDNPKRGKSALIQVNGSGKMQWAKEYGLFWADVNTNQLHALYDMTLSGTNIAITGDYDETNYSTKVHIVKTDLNGNSGASCNEHTPSLDTLTHPFAFQALALTSSAISGLPLKSSPFAVSASASISADPCAAGIEELNNAVNVIITPNPFTTAATLKIKDSNLQIQNLQFSMYDLFGREVKHQQLSSGKNEFIIERGNIAEGMYFYRISSNEKSLATGKLLIK